MSGITRAREVGELRTHRYQADGGKVLLHVEVDRAEDGADMRQPGKVMKWGLGRVIRAIDARLD